MRWKEGANRGKASVRLSVSQGCERDELKQLSTVDRSCYMNNGEGSSLWAVNDDVGVFLPRNGVVLFFFSTSFLLERD